MRPTVLHVMPRARMYGHPAPEAPLSYWVMSPSRKQKPAVVPCALPARAHLEREKPEEAAPKKGGTWALVGG